MSTTRIQLRGDSASNWSTANPILADRELALETDTLRYKIGNGILPWNSLPYGGITGAAGSSGTSGTAGTSGSAGSSGSSGTSGTAGTSGTSGIVPTNVYYDMQVAASDETTAITTGTSKVAFYSPIAWTVTGVTATLTTTGSTNCVFDINDNGVSIVSNGLTLPSGNFYTATTINNAVSAYDRFTVDIDTAGSGSTGFKIILTGNKPI